MYEWIILLARYDRESVESLIYYLEAGDTLILCHKDLLTHGLSICSLSLALHLQQHSLPAHQVTDKWDKAYCTAAGYMLRIAERGGFWQVDATTLYTLQWTCRMHDGAPIAAVLCTSSTPVSSFGCGRHFNCCKDYFSMQVLLRPIVEKEVPDSQACNCYARWTICDGPRLKSLCMTVCYWPASIPLLIRIEFVLNPYHERYGIWLIMLGAYLR